MSRRRTATATAAVAAAILLSGCSGDDAHALGKAVEVEFHDSESQLVASGTVAVTDVREGSPTDLEAAGYTLDETQMAATVRYVDVTFDNAGEEPVTPHSPGGEDPDGNLIPALTVIDFSGGGEVFEACPGLPEAVPAGAQAEGCSIVLVPDGTEMERVYYHPGGSEEFVYWTTE